jgi:hypothetical protein
MNWIVYYGRRAKIAGEEAAVVLITPESSVMEDGWGTKVEGVYE